MIHRRKDRLINLSTASKVEGNQEQECIPVGCVLTASMAASTGEYDDTSCLIPYSSRGGGWVLPLWRGVCLQGGMCLQKRVSSSGGTPPWTMGPKTGSDIIPPPVNRMTDRYKNITFPKFRWEAVGKGLSFLMSTYSKCPGPVARGYCVFSFSIFSLAINCNYCATILHRRLCLHKIWLKSLPHRNDDKVACAILDVFMSKGTPGFSWEEPMHPY